MSLVIGYRWRAYDVLRLVLALVLLAAAVLKAHQLMTEPVVGTVPNSVSAKLGLSPSAVRWFLIGVVELDLFWGLWLLATLLPSTSVRGAVREGSELPSPSGRGTEGEGNPGDGLPTWLISLVLFWAFACVSLYKAMRGDAACGCFGTAGISPWYTLTLDACVVASLLVSRPRNMRLKSQLSTQVLGRLGLVCMIWLVAGGYAGLRARAAESAPFTAYREIGDGGNVIVSVPETWVGRRFPLLDRIDIGAQLQSGKWEVLLFRRDCGECTEAVDSLRDAPQELGGRRIALVEISGLGEQTGFTPSSVVEGRLAGELGSGLRTPLFLSIDNGRVVAESE